MESLASKPTLESPANEDRSAFSSSVQHQTLLKALQDLIVRVMDPKQTNDKNLIPSGPEAGKLIIALQEFISSIVLGSQSKASNTIKVDLQEGDKELRRSDLEDDECLDSESVLVGHGGSAYDEENKLQTSVLEDNELQGGGNDVNDGEEEVPIFIEPPSRPLSVASDVGWDDDTYPVAFPKLEPELTFEEKLLRALREHVFNKMPIRLLCFTPVGSSLQISLFERGAIYKRIASALEGEMKKYQLHHRMETDEEAIKRLINKYASYAILSHVWLRTTAGEVTYSVWNNGLFNPEDLGYKKLVNFCKAAWNDYQLIFGWMDTVCINKESSSELDESMRSMYNWYERATVCVTYLAETEALANMHLDPWFTRGWTLQELLAPRFIKFYNSHWQHLVNHSRNEKWDKEITEQICLATTISTDELDNIHHAPISRRMQLAAPREVTREEDTAYALMGIFNVSISTAYGEGAERAFIRLLQEIITSSTGALDILNWAGDIPFSHLHSTSAVLPTSPKWYITRSSARNLAPQRPIEPLTLSHLGLHVQVLLMPGLSILHTELRRKPVGDYNAVVDISLPTYYHKKIPRTYNLLDNGISGQDGWKDNKDKLYQMTFAVFNFAGSRNTISIPKTCMALILECDEPAGEVSKSGRFSIIRTERPVVFKLSREIANSDMDYWSWKIQTDELENHGMQLTSLYL